MPLPFAFPSSRSRKTLPLKGVPFPLLGEVYLPRSWITDPARLARVGVPEDKREVREKWKLALELLGRVRGGLSYEAIVMDAGYGEIRPFLHALDQREQCFVAQIPESHCFWPATIALEEHSKPGGRPRRFPMLADPRTAALGQSVAGARGSGKTTVAEGEAALTAAQDRGSSPDPGPRNDHTGVAPPWPGALVTH